MIQIQKSAAPAALLAALGAPAARLAFEQRHDRNPTACQVPGNKVMNVPATIYNDPALKALLIADQHEKCCYCERYFLDNNAGDVEHFRPKNGFKQRKADKGLMKPGYYWLAYEWSNLFFACNVCNRSFKRNYFPLKNDPAGRVRSHHAVVGTEQPLLVDPALDNPATHIRFQRAVAVGRSDRGRATIAACGLNRLKLRERREQHLYRIERDEVLADYNIAAMTPAEVQQKINKYGNLRVLARRIKQARDVFNTAALSNAEFAGMVRSRFPHLPQ